MSRSGDFHGDNRQINQLLYPHACAQGNYGSWLSCLLFNLSLQHMVHVAKMFMYCLCTISDNALEFLARASKEYQMIYF